MRVIAVLCSDIHLSHTPPVARSTEPDWYAAQGRVLQQLNDIAVQHGVEIICAGDVFDRHNPPVELVNWALKNLPQMYSIPGQHDLPYHDIQQIHKSAYHTLEVHGVITPLQRMTVKTGVFKAQGAVYDELPEADSAKAAIRIAVAHKYIWSARDTSYPGAPVESNIKNLVRELQGFDVAVFGDNHTGFSYTNDDLVVYNCGCLIPRKSDERLQTPSVGLLYSDGSVRRHSLDVSEDKWLEVEQVEAIEVAGMEEFINGLQKLDSEIFDFMSEVERYISDNDVDDKVASIILESMEKKHGH